MKKILLTACFMVLLISQPAMAKWEGDGSNAFVCGFTLLAPRWIEITVVKDGEPVPDQEVTITRYTMQGGIPLFTREPHYTNAEGKVFFTTLWGLFGAEVGDWVWEGKIGQGALFKLNRVTIDISEE